MRGIVITHSVGVWSFERAPGDRGFGSSPLTAGIAARDFGETLRGKALGYIIRLDHSGAGPQESMITLHAQVF